VCQVDLVPIDQSPENYKSIEPSQSMQERMANTARNQSKKIDICPQANQEGPDHPRESMKSSIDFYQRTYNADDLISLYRHTKYYIYAICKCSL
jgi:hypothetical protein